MLGREVVGVVDGEEEADETDVAQLEKINVFLLRLTPTLAQLGVYSLRDKEIII